MSSAMMTQIFKITPMIVGVIGVITVCYPRHHRASELFLNPFA
jgi:hypothetical protein